MATLHELLDAGLGLDPEYEDQLSSHLPMALDALQDLGADAARLREFQRRYGARLSPVPQQPTQGSARPAQLGRIEDYPAWFAHYRAALQTQGRDALLRRELPALMTGVGGAAFHGLIRVGHALRHGHAGELAAALAYWASRHLPLASGERTPSTPLSLPDWLAALSALPDQEAMPQRRLIFQRMVDWSRREDWRALAGRLPSGELPALARHAAALYVHTGDFTVLHLVTASAALLLMLKPWLEAQDLAPFVPAVAAALLSGSAAARSAMADPLPVGEPVQDWPALASAAVAQHNDHAIKLVAACRMLDRVDPAPVWRAAAARALRGLI
ncbi:questin oxidase family protein [Roseateles sp. DAIF2]|uniref:questin oxidase family protein n=1 Tax=Roseateles sp. DAIF2 TaxID=2714952 RepID=UPI0018A2A521|nr:questin oxidase family protein [Roseateles sp. DAIF2]QPF72041.1 questin oxidase family protein [Roseateles sp. DAIF2]